MMDTNTASVYRDRNRYLWLTALVWPLMPVLGIYLAEISNLSVFYWLLPIEIYILLPLLDEWIGKDTNNPPDDIIPALEQDRYYRIVTWVTVPLYYFTMTLSCWVLASWGLPWYELLGLVISLGLVNGVAVNVGHELGHKNTRLEKWLAKFVLALSVFGHFTIDHNRGHHRFVATPEDESSAAMGETLYRFALREMWQGIFRAWRLERERLQQLERPVWSLKNEFIQPLLISLVYYTVLVVAFGLILIPFLLIQAFIAWFQLSTADYIEHYGLLRQQDSKGLYLPCQPEHSWNSNNILSNLILFNLQRHSDHHAHGARRYQSLRNIQDAPQLPGGYPKMFLMALFPFWWRRVMDQRLMNHYGGDLSLVHKL